MRIKSSFHDFYDQCMSHGQDADLLYLREEREEPLTFSDIPYWQILDNARSLHHLDVRQWTIGFCGKLYPTFEIAVVEHRTAESNKDHHLSSLADIDKFVESNFKKPYVDAYYALDPRNFAKWRANRRYRQLWPEAYCHKRFEQLFAACANAGTKFMHVFEEKRCPIFAVSYLRTQQMPTIAYNVCLREHEFFRIKDPYTAFQEIQMFMSNLAWPNRPIPEVSNDDLIAAKGFDRFSFRKEPTKKR
jgi:hypothetical protein